MTTTLRQLSGESIGQYELRELYGIGGMGAVYRAYHRTLDRDVAFKVMSLTYAMQTEFIERFGREAKLAASLEHPNIVPVYDYGAMQEWQYVVMRLLTGGSMAERIEQMKGKPPSIDEISQLLHQLAGALDYAHSRNIVHRDIKSNNIMFDSHGTPYVVDFGIAKLIQDNSTRLTADGLTVGTPTHMAPELWDGEDASAASDQYALAIVVYELLTGRVPFTATNPFALMSRHMQETPESVQKYVPQLNSDIDMILWRAMAKDKTERYPSVMAFSKDFASVAQRMPEVETGFFTMELRRHLVGTDPNAKPANINTPAFGPGAIPSTPPATRAVPPPTNPAGVGAGRPQIKSLSSLPKAPVAASIPSALPKAPPNPTVIPTPDLTKNRPPVVSANANAVKPKRTAPLPPIGEVARPIESVKAGESLKAEEPVRERIVFVERKDKPTPTPQAAGCASVLVDSFINLLGLTISSTIRAAVSLVVSSLVTLAFIIGGIFLVINLARSPSIRNLANQLRASIAAIGSQAAQSGIQPSFTVPTPQPVQQQLPPPPLPPGRGGPPPAPR